MVVIVTPESDDRSIRAPGLEELCASRGLRVDSERHDRLLGVNKTVIRGGFRIAYDPAFYNMFLNVATAAPKVNFASLGPLVGGPTTGIPSTGVFGTQVIPFLEPLAAGGNPGFANQTEVPHNFRNPYTEQWNVGIQHSFTPRVVAEVALRRQPRRCAIPGAQWESRSCATHQRRLSECDSGRSYSVQ